MYNEPSSTQVCILHRKSTWRLGGFQVKLYCNSRKLKANLHPIYIHTLIFFLINSFKSSYSICLTSFGIPAYSQTCEDHFKVHIKISNPEDPKTTMQVQDTVPHSTNIYHVKFPRPYKIRKDTWYDVSACITVITLLNLLYISCCMQAIKFLHTLILLGYTGLWKYWGKVPDHVKMHPAQWKRDHC